MHPASLASRPPCAADDRGRAGTAADLADALRESRRDTLSTFAAYEAALPHLGVPLCDELNPPLWEIGHVGWFQEFWVGRNPERGLGCRADPRTPRLPGSRVDAESLYHSSLVAHDDRWSLPLPDASTTRAELAKQLETTLALLDGADLAQASADDGLYFFRLSLLHEDMHHEAALYMAQGLGIPIDDPRWQPLPLSTPPVPLYFGSEPWQLGGGDAPGFSFDNELSGKSEFVGPVSIDAQAVRWAEYLPFVIEGGYERKGCWCPEGWSWQQRTRARMPRYLRREGGHWQRYRHGQWLALDSREAACHLTWYEADAWCRWARRRLPTEAEWERAACTLGDVFRWGDVWEWTASPFQPYPGFRPHPYRDYSQPWFDGRPVLRGASFMTQPRMRHPRYRNFFRPDRCDLPAGFRSCAL